MFVFIYEQDFWSESVEADRKTLHHVRVTLNSDLMMFSLAVFIFTDWAFDFGKL